MLRIGIVPIVRPLFRGSKFGLEAKSLEALRSLSLKLGFEVAYVSEPVATEEQAQTAARAARDANLDLLLIQHVTFSTGEVFLPLLDLPIPVGLWALPEVWDHGPLPQNAICGLNLGVSLVGTQRLASARTGPVKWFYGNVEDEWFQSRLKLTLEALRGARVLRYGRVLWLGGTAPGFFAFDAPVETGMTVEKVPLDELWAALEGVSELAVNDALDAFDEHTEYSKEELRPTVRLELALAQLARGYDGVAIREWPEIPEKTGVMAYSAMARLADQGQSWAPEGDILGLASMLALGAVTGQPAILLDLSHISPRGLMLWHGGEAPKAWTDGPTKLVPHFNRGIPAVRDMALKAGLVSGLRLLPGRKAVVHGGALNGEKGYDGDSGWMTRASWACQDLTSEQFLASWLNYRVPHHMALGMGNHQPALMEMCAWLGLETLPPLPEEHTLIWQK
ncbi:MAG: fucose isomerase [Armatimonadota bacterium]